MFYYISGKLTYLEPNTAVVDAGGVGYKLTISQSTYAKMPAHRSVDTPPQVQLFTHMAVREDGIELFGFASEEELDSFKLLITVSGVGPKAAISILSLLSPQKLAYAICTDDKKTISKASGIGPKTAARIVLELKDKLGSQSFSDDGTAMTAQELADLTSSPDKLSDAVSALSVLGYTKSEAEGALKKIKNLPELDVDDIIREALKILMR
jgi:Holliday junction DNA helicase RuvA